MGTIQVFGDDFVLNNMEPTISANFMFRSQGDFGGCPRYLLDGDECFKSNLVCKKHVQSTTRG